jgi:hypothetical protein
VGGDRPQLEFPVSALAALLMTGLAAGFIPMRSAAPLPPGEWRLELAGGLGLVRIGLPALPVLPLFVGDVELGRGLAAPLDLRLRYTTYLGLVHRVGGELRWGFHRGLHHALGARVGTSVQIVGATLGGVDVAGHVDSQAALLASWRRPRFALTGDAGFTVQWVLFESLADVRRVDRRPYPAYVDVAVAAEWPRGKRANLSVRLEVPVSLTPDDPFAIGRTYPRLLFGGNFGL